MATDILTNYQVEIEEVFRLHHAEKISIDDAIQQSAFTRAKFYSVDQITRETLEAGVVRHLTEIKRLAREKVADEQAQLEIDLLRRAHAILRQGLEVEAEIIADSDQKAFVRDKAVNTVLDIVRHGLKPTAGKLVINNGPREEEPPLLPPLLPAAAQQEALPLPDELRQVEEIIVVRRLKPADAAHAAK